MAAVTSGPTPPPLPPPVPVPVQALPYSATPPDARRPAIITTLGVLAIVVAALSGIVSFLTFVYGGMFYAVFLPLWSAGAGAATVTNSSTSSTTTFSTGVVGTPAPPPQPSQDKLSMADASTAVNTLQNFLELDGARVRELDKLIRAHGREVLGGPVDEDDDRPGPITNAWLRESIKSHGSAPDPDSAAWFSNALGRVEIYPNHTVFKAADGSTTIRSSAVERTESVTNGSDGGGSTAGATTSPAQGQGSTLTKAEIRRVMVAVRRASPRTLTPAQARTIEQQLGVPNQGLVTPGSAQPVTGVTYSNGSLEVEFDTGSIDVGMQGQINGVTTGTTAGFGPSPFPPTTGLRVRPPLLLVVLEAMGSLALAVYLLVVGILVCRSSFHSPKLLRVYAWIKIPLVCLASFAAGWLSWRILEVAATASSTAGGSPPPPPGYGWAFFYGIIVFVVGIAFPAFVLLCLRARTVRQFFNSVSA